MAPSAAFVSAPTASSHAHGSSHLKTDIDIKIMKSKSVSHPKTWFFCLIGTISISAGFTAFEFDFLVAQQILLRLLQSTPTIAESPILVELFPFKVFATTTIFVFVPLLLGWYFRENFAGYVLATSSFFLISILISLGVLAVYRDYMQTELRLTIVSELPASISRTTPMTLGQITAVTEVPIAKMLLTSPLLFAIGAFFWIRKRTSSA